MWTPLNDQWEKYRTTMETANLAGELDDPDSEDAQKVVWPRELFIGTEEQDDLKRFVFARIDEIQQAAGQNRQLTMELIGAYLFRSVLAGMMWERERIGL